MVRACLAVLALAGCSFEPRPAAAPDAAGDGQPAPDDAPMVEPCSVVPDGDAVALEALGGPGGSPAPDLGCAAGELMLGLGFDVSSGGIDNHGDQLAMVNVHARCGRVTRGPDGVFRATPAALATAEGGMGDDCGEYFPTVAAPEVLCPDDHVLVGVTGNLVDSTLYNTVAIVCAELDPGGAITGETVTVPIAGTGSFTGQPQASTCAAGAIAGFGVRRGCGQDQLVLRCVPTACRP